MRLGFSFLLILPWLHLATGSLLIAAFNIKTFGDKKASNSTLVDIIVKIVHRYDVILIQEVRDSDLTATRKLMESVNSGISPFHYEYIASEPLGRDTYKERYLFIYRDDMVSVVESFLYDGGCEACGTDTFSREPFVVMFSSKRSGVPDFALIPQHTSPDSAVKEIDALYDVVDETRSFLGTDNILLLGDFNAGCNYVLESDWEQIRLHTDRSYHWLIPNSADTTVTNTECPYDRIVATATMMQYVVPGSAAIYDFMTALKLSQSLALAVSDHFPVEVQLKGA
nr:deoxyribonuclease-1 [Paramormyrops kingsleyae]XP_023677885.1 deoxyribonuclease-1 [Paramormyrops kingsleyae]XP_023677886.1 deoxyribonuclease-1 [Paramormyrops kingsleyae]XP_023677887.1 deoxyribonuclease-1 [Paramormyrops kingsleyae]